MQGEEKTFITTKIVLCKEQNYNELKNKQMGTRNKMKQQKKDFCKNNINCILIIKRSVTDACDSYNGEANDDITDDDDDRLAEGILEIIYVLLCPRAWGGEQ